MTTKKDEVAGRINFTIKELEKARDWIKRKDQEEQEYILLPTDDEKLARRIERHRLPHESWQETLLRIGAKGDN